MSKVVRISIQHLSQNISGHSHKEAQILIPLTGLIFLTTDLSAYTLDDRSLCLIAPGVTHYYNGSDDNEVLVIDISGHGLKQVDADRLTDADMYFVSENIQRVRALMLAELEKPASPFTQDYLFFYLYDLLLARPVSPSIDHISSHYDEAISIKALADLEHYSENYYREWFRKRTGMSPSAYIQRFRVEKAKELLLSTKYSVSDIAYQVGFSHHSSFTRAFCQLEGTYPSDYRKRL